MKRPEGNTARPENKAKSGQGHGQAASCYCYVLECSDGSYYTGWTSDPERRIKAHNAGRGGRYTRSRRPVRLIYVEPQEDRRAAMRREHAIKGMTRLRKQRLIQGSGPRDLRHKSRQPKSGRKRKTDAPGP